MSTSVEERFAVPARLLEAARPRCYGRVSGVTGAAIEVEGLSGTVGDVVRIERAGRPLLAEVSALRRHSCICLPLGDPAGVGSGSLVEALGEPMRVRVGPGLLGRVLDGLGNPIDGKGPLVDTEPVGVHARVPNPLERPLVRERLALGVRVIDGLTPCGRGQRLGVFAGSGVGKSSLLSMITRHTSASVCVLALIGERGREVAEFLERDLGEEGRKRAVVVVATSDEPAMVRIRAAFVATAIAEAFRDRGSHVLLLMDSLTRFAMAQREVGLAAGEPPTTRGYPPSVYGLLPRLLERAGTAPVGSITGIYTVLVEGDDMNEPVADAVRSILDGHVTLSRALAEAGHYPAVDPLASISRVAPAVSSSGERAAASRVRALLSAWRDAKDLVEIGAYVVGTNPTVDEALKAKAAIDAFCVQGMDDEADLDSTVDALLAFAERTEPGERAEQ